jgi:hypothetical protein
MTELFKKLNFKGQSPLLVLDAPPFGATRAGLLAAASAVLPLLGEEAVLWFAYPKGSSKSLKSEVNRDSLWELMAPLGLRPVRQIAIDEDWSALRFKRE